MKITKYKHSCLLLENEKARVLFDPGEFSWADFSDELKKLEDLDFIIVTHEHGDHYFPEALKKIALKNPQAKIICPDVVATKLNSDGIELERELEHELFSINLTEHAHLDQTLPVFDNIRVIFDGRFLHPGDNMDMEESPDILAIPIFGPWYNGTITDAIDLVIKLKPKFVVPIHDWHYKDEVRHDFQKRLRDRTKDFGVTALIQPDGETVEV
jgi:L-ascorbate metabolism protein UlaG (beta-lactamase superfamily)